MGTLNRVLVQTDGKVLVAGSFTKIDGATRTRLARFNGDGTLDTLFVPPALTINIVSLAQQADAKVLVGGDFTSVAGNAQRNRLIRLNADGSLDTTFNPTGNGPSSTVNAISVLASGQVMIGGLFTNYNNRVVNGVARLNSDGSLDPTFAPPSAGSGVYALVVQSDGKILIGGSFTTANVINRNRIARLNAGTPLRVDVLRAPRHEVATAFRGGARGVDLALWVSVRHSAAEGARPRSVVGHDRTDSVGRPLGVGRTTAVAARAAHAGQYSPKLAA